jgi:hypothetical protein
VVFTRGVSERLQPDGAGERQVSIRQHSSEYFSIRQHTCSMHSAYLQHTSAYVIIRGCSPTALASDRHISIYTIHRHISSSDRHISMYSIDTSC